MNMNNKSKKSKIQIIVEWLPFLASPIFWSIIFPFWLVILVPIAIIGAIGALLEKFADRLSDLFSIHRMASFPPFSLFDYSNYGRWSKLVEKQEEELKELRRAKCIHENDIAWYEENYPEGKAKRAKELEDFRKTQRGQEEDTHE